jgi:hypothetical protein
LNAGATGTIVTITGQYFGASQLGNSVTFNGVPASQVNLWSDTQIIVGVPSDATSGAVVVTVAGSMSNGVSFTVVPLVASLSLTSGSVGTQVTITGSGFGASQGASIVTFNGTAGAPPVWNSASITVQVPPGATTGNVVVTVGGIPSNGTGFTVLPNGFKAASGQMAASRYGQTATQLTTGQVLIAGGMSSSGVVSSVDIYSLANQTITAANAMNIARWLHTATLLNDGTVLIAGGSDLANDETLDSAEIYNPATGTFTLLSNTLNTARVGHTATLLNNGQVLIVGGYDPDTGLIADAELYDPPTQTFIDLGDTNVPRYKHTATMLQSGLVLITGGEIDPVPSAAYNTAELYNPASQGFTPVPVPMTTAREGHAAVILSNGQVLIAGGDIPGTGSLNTAELYDPVSNTFAAIAATMTVPRTSHIMTLLNGGKVLIDGGAADSPTRSTPFNTAELFDPASQAFMLVGNMASDRKHQTATLLNDGTVLIAGGTDGNNIFSTAEIYTLSQLSGLVSIAITPATSSIGAGTQQHFAAIGTFSDGSTQTLASALWSSSSIAVAPISGDATNPGVAASTAQGTTTITANALTVSGSSILTVATPALVSISLSPQSTTIPLGTSQQFAATGTYTDGTTQDVTATATWSSSAMLVATVSGSGAAAGLSPGTTTVQAKIGSLSSSTTLSVTAPALVSITVTPSTATIGLGSSQQFQAIGTYSDGSTQNITTLLTWSSGTPAIATVTSSGLAQGESQGTVLLTAGFEAVSVSVTLNVTAPTLVSIAIAPNAASLSVGSTQQLSVIGSYTDGSTQNLTAASTWASSNPSVIGVSSTGLANALVSGSATITATSGATSSTAALVVTTGTSQASLNTGRYQHSATNLSNGQILVVGGVSCPTAGSCVYLSSAELYNPTTSTFNFTSGSMATARSAPAVQLNSGKVLVAGGYTCDSSGNCTSLSSAEIYDPIAGTFSSAGTMTIARSGHTMAVLGNGTVLIAGGENCASATSCSALSSAEIYDPNAGTFKSTTTSMSAARFGASAILLNTGSVLIVGGFDGTNLPSVVEIYNPATSGFTSSGPSLNVPRFYATATLLNNGQVLVAGGSTCGSPGCPTNGAEIYDPVANAFSIVVSGLNVPRFDHTATLLTNGNVLIAGGYNLCISTCSGVSSTEYYDSVAGVFTSDQPVANALAGHTGSLLANGNVLLVGGINAGVTLSNDEWYQPSSYTPAGLVSVTVAPSDVFLMPGQTQQLVATGTFNDGSTQTLQSVIWNSSNSAAAIISNSPGSAGIVNAQATGATTLTATAGDVGGSASLSVAQLVSLAITPLNPSITLGSSQQFTANGTFSDGSVQNLTNSVTWGSSNYATILISTLSPLQGVAMGVLPGSATITANLGATQATTSATVQPAPVAQTPIITSISSATGTAGIPITIVGSGFGSPQGGGSVWLGSTYGIVGSWSDTQIVATVASNSTSGTAQVQQGGLSSNAVPFNVNTATILSVSPASGIPGTPVTITGSYFGTTPGQVWLGTANGVVQSWSDTQVVAEVATGAMSGSAQVMQNGVMSNAIPFTINSLNLVSVNPTSGGPNTQVTITGTGFGSSQGEGSVWLGSTNGQVVSWNNTQIVAQVAINAVTGIVRVQQNGVWSNALTFTVPSSGGNAVIVTPNILNLVVGQTQNIQALNTTGQPVPGLTWNSSNTQVVSLSTDDPPVLTAVAAGRATITAGTASADVTVYAGSTLPIGTVIWSNPGDGSGVTKIVPAVPSVTGVADVFAFQGDGTVQAVKSDGTVAWAATGGNEAAIPDFQGGLTTAAYSFTAGTTTISKLNGMTGLPIYSVSIPHEGNLLAHPDGTVFDLQMLTAGVDGYPKGYAVVGLDAATGSQKFIVPLDQSTYTGTAPTPASLLGTPIIAGDGYAYFAYTYATSNATQNTESTATAAVLHLMLMRVGTDGSTSKMDVKDWTATSQSTGTIDQSTTTQSGDFPQLQAQVITNADEGVVLSWGYPEEEYCTSYTHTDYYNGCNNEAWIPAQYGLATTSGGSLASLTTTNIPGQVSGITPVLQAQDGTLVGTVALGTSSTTSMIGFDSSGNVKWSVPNDTPQIATADGGVIGASGITYDSNGNTTGKATVDVQSWTSYLYQGSSQAFWPISATPVIPATPPSFSFAGGNQSSSGVSPLCRSDLNQFLQEYVTYKAGFMPTCQQFWSEIQYSSNRNEVFFPFNVMNQDDIKADDHPNWALLQSSMLNGIMMIELVNGGPIAITSAYRSPLVQNNLDQNNIQAGKQKVASPHSRHLHGDAVDIATYRNDTTWFSMKQLVRNNIANVCIEPLRFSTNNHLHVDWRPWSMCPEAWQQ